jgi:16S rRNA (cytosine967-C5)-methyltransferase
MAAIADAVRPGGRLVYAVCSFSHEETGEVIEAFLAEHPHFRAVSASAVAPQIGSDFFTDGVLRTYPHEHDADAFFGAVLEREA